MMKQNMKKLVCFAVLLCAIGFAAVGQQFAEVTYERNGNMATFRARASEVIANMKKSYGGFYDTDKLPNEVIQAINNRLSSYTLNIGDIFNAAVGFGRTYYAVVLRIAGIANGRWQWDFYACRKYDG